MWSVLSLTTPIDGIYWTNSFPYFRLRNHETGCTFFLCLESMNPQRPFCVWLKLAPGSGEKDFKIFSIEIHYFAFISPWRKTWPVIWTNLNPLHPRMLCAKFGWNWPGGSGEEVENVKSLQTDKRTDRQMTVNRRSEKLIWAFSSGELKIKKCII